MKNDLISRDALKNDLKQYFTDGVLDGVSAKLAFNQILHDIDNAPTVETKTIMECIIAYGDGYETARLLYERPQGEWVEDKFGDHFCSNCKNYAFYNEFGSEAETRYCPHCGADMRGGTE